MLSRFFSRRPGRPSKSARLAVEFLEARETPTVNVMAIGAQEMASDRAFFLPISVTNSPTGTVTHTAATNNANVSAQVLTGRSVTFNVTYGAGQSGSFTVQLFDDVAPQAAQRIVDLVNSGFYTNKTFFRIEDLFADAARTNVIIQGGGANNTDNSTLPDIEEEFNKDVTFASNGLVALAKTSFPVSSNSQFFITDLDRPVSERIEVLNYRYTIFGILTSGFDTFTAMKNVPKTGTAPNSPITITGAAVTPDANDPKAVIKFTPTAAGFLGTTSVTVNSTDSSGTTTTTFNLTGVTDPATSNPPFLQPVPNTLTATSGQATTLTVTPFDKEGNAVVYSVRDAEFGGAPANLSFSINQATGQITLTPASTFTGTAQFTVGVRDAAAADSPGNYAAQLVTMTVNAPTSPPPVSPPPPTTDNFTVTGSTAGSEPRIIATNSDGTQRFSVLAFEAGFTGGVRTAIADVNGDGKKDVVVVPADGGASVVKVLDGTDGHVLFSKLVFEDSFRGGLFLDVGDARGLGYSQVLVGAGQGGGPRVTLLDVKQNTLLLNYFAADQTTRGGISVDVGEIVTGRGQMIVTGGGPGNGPVVNVYAPDGRRLGSFLAGDVNNRDGIRVKIGETVNTSFSARPILVAPFGSTSDADFKEFNAVPFLSLA